MVARHALLRNSKAPGSFEVRVLRVEDFPVLATREGQLYLREGKMQPWKNDDLQSFPPLRSPFPAKWDIRVVPS